MRLQLLVADFEEVWVFAELVDHGADVGSAALGASACFAEGFEGVSTVNAERVFACGDASLDGGENKRDCAAHGEDPEFDFATKAPHEDTRQYDCENGDTKYDAEAWQENEPLPAEGFGDFRRAWSPEGNVSAFEHGDKVGCQAFLNASAKISGRCVDRGRVRERGFSWGLRHGRSVEGIASGRAVPDVWWGESGNSSSEMGKRS